MRNVSIAAASVALAVMLTGAAYAQMSPPIPMSANEFSRAATGQDVQIVVRVRSRNR